MATPPDFTAYTPLAAATLNKVGLWLVKSQTVGTGVASVTVTDAFSADYDNYRITWTGGTLSAGSVIDLQLGSSTTAYYNGLIFNGSYASPTAQAVSRNNGANWSWVGYGDTVYESVECDVLTPYLTRYTSLRLSYAADGNAGAGAGIHKLSTSYTSFTLLPDNAGVTMTGGTICVYGYNNG
jgi:hypothetical protein